MEKDYSLLRPIDLEAAKAGEAICENDATPCYFAAEAGPDHAHAVRGKDGNLFWGYGEDLRMAPLAWVEGRPVYKGDVLHHGAVGNFIVEGIYRENEGWDCGPSLAAAGFDGYGLFAHACTWATPAPKPIKQEGYVIAFKGDLVPLEEAERRMANITHNGELVIARAEWGEAK